MLPYGRFCVFTVTEITVNYSNDNISFHFIYIFIFIRQRASNDSRQRDIQTYTQQTQLENKIE